MNHSAVGFAIVIAVVTALTYFVLSWCINKGEAALADPTRMRQTTPQEVKTKIAQWTRSRRIGVVSGVILLVATIALGVFYPGMFPA